MLSGNGGTRTTATGSLRSVAARYARRRERTRPSTCPLCSPIEVAAAGREHLQSPTAEIEMALNRVVILFALPMARGIRHFGQ
jgi:hypothetical protein